MQALAGKVAIVTGASRGIGEAAALALGAAGASVVLAARSVKQAEANAQQIAAAGGKAFALECDVSDYDACQQLVQRDCAPVRAAGYPGQQRRGDRADQHGRDGRSTEWARSIEINLIGAYYAIRAVLPGMLERGHGDIINVSSGAALRPLEGWSAYCSGKAGLAMLTRAIDLEHRAGGIRVFGFQPGTTDTDMQVAIRASGINVISKIPREKLTPVALPARAIVYLCTKAADEYAGKEFSLNDDEFRRRALGG